MDGAGHHITRSQRTTGVVTFHEWATIGIHQVATFSAYSLADEEAGLIMQGGPAYDGTSEDDGTDGANAPAKVGDGGAAAGPAARRSADGEISQWLSPDVTSANCGSTT